MNDDELKKLWQEQPLRQPTPSTADLFPAMQSKMSLLRRTLDARDLGELVACAFVIITFGSMYFTVYRGPMSRYGVLIVIGGSIFIAWKIVYGRLTTPQAAPDATLVESLRAELNAVRTQSRALQSVLWWYILPLFIGETVATWGLPIDPVGKGGCTIIFVAVNAWVYRINQQAVAKQFVPLETQLLAMLHSAETGEPLDETHAANLRPIVSSIASLGQVKPVESKVAFWQLAVFGIPGVVGIWFFLMLTFTLGNQDRLAVFNAPSPVTAPVPVEESNRYSVVARTIVDLLNAGDDAAVQKLFAPQMSEALPPPKASEFFKGLATKYGRIDEFDGPTANGYGGWIAFQLHGQRGELTMSLALDSKDRIAGIYFQPRLKSFSDLKSFVFELFSWQHLLWLLPFFVASLIYTRFIQKTIERAVGISSLGIHLAQGQNLVLWDEIKDVQPMKFLHIINLWLVAESGEKTFMYWTPLERRSDVKAAVEEFAPANHPIRRFLHLLSRT